MEQLLNQLQYWHWLSFGIVLIVFEVLGAGGILLWSGVAALIVGIILWAVPIAWEIQLLLFAVLSIAAVIIWRMYWKKHPEKIERPHLNQRAQRLIGHEFILPALLSPGESIQVKIAGTQWKVVSEVKITVGRKVRVAQVLANEVHVQAVDES
ncbi:Inner membrane protein YbbJ [Piscirickettsia salmonis]|uniref:Inner membrane protein YbbJ n=1 Tax=Piscirickettsia salmonis TaxID=1238 RepID=A0A9Q6LNQ6_PISSA|nr:NfeD family protein [Piscirickettsia salmonis]QGN96409.1 Inner membrane protein YbbJ [Piscirickettsia salmonis]QGO07351.1 Inner membrane protein YbbJ [Piscirickettsia salmonis]QGO35679.1 Inner membrane protein YbbJ [Piscirickettsia salmonis]QGO39297.1 Inner membrane protein YbbJ [Piscirickettsia salmonis]QGO42911.1 Inner membrane protein YbbJ [Piscirickettsia salmonis]